MSFRDDLAWADRRQEDVRAIVSRHLGAIISVRFASAEEDTKQATDMVVELAGGTIAVRVRDTTRDFRDWTVRSRRRSGVPTELHKLRAGFARWYLYAWCAPGGTVGDYVLIDLDAVRFLGLLDVPRREQTADGGATHFVAIGVPELRATGCLVVDQCKSPCPAPRAGHRPAPGTKGGPGQPNLSRFSAAAPDAPRPPGPS